ncbi:MAG: N-ethylmaleimide reductase, partial [Arenimonas sp.]
MSVTLFDALRIGPFTLKNRVLMAPLTRMRAGQPGDIPTALMAEYYRQRASAGLVITEATQISPEGKGYADTPGLYNAAQTEGWKQSTAAVHDAGGLICMQLWHVGRVSHTSLQIDGQAPVSASDKPYENRTTIKDADGNLVRAACSTPRALRTDEIPRLLEEYRVATRNARAAGFDMVEIHAAHGYLLHQFMSEESNFRTDQYGGSLENRARLCLEVVDAVIGEWDASHVGIRISPLGIFNGLNDLAGQEMGLYLAAEFAKRGLGYLHLSEPDWAGGPALDTAFREKLRAAFPGVIIAAG